jgi:hypothetical protein
MFTMFSPLAEYGPGFCPGELLKVAMIRHDCSTADQDAGQRFRFC